MVDAASFAPAYAETGFSCTMDGYTELVSDTIDALIFGIPIALAMFEAVMPENIALSVKHLYKGLKGANVWPGYLMAAGYYMALDQGYGSELCEASGIVWLFTSLFSRVLNWNNENASFSNADNAANNSNASN